VIVNGILAFHGQHIRLGNVTQQTENAELLLLLFISIIFRAITITTSTQEGTEQGGRFGEAVADTRGEQVPHGNAAHQTRIGRRDESVKHRGQRFIGQEFHGRNVDRRCATFQLLRRRRCGLVVRDANRVLRRPNDGPTGILAHD
jgi:hypothetical protein